MSQLIVANGPRRYRKANLPTRSERWSKAWKISYRHFLWELFIILFVRNSSKGNLYSSVYKKK